MPGLSISLELGSIEDAMLTNTAERGADDRWRLKLGIGPACAVSRIAIDGPDGLRFIQFGKATEEGLDPVVADL